MIMDQFYGDRLNMRQVKRSSIILNMNDITLYMSSSIILYCLYIVYYTQDGELRLVSM